MKKFLLFILISCMGYICFAENFAVTRPFFAAVYQYAADNGLCLDRVDLSSKDSIETYEISNITDQYKIEKKGLFGKKQLFFQRIYNITITKNQGKSFEINLGDGFRFAQFNDDFTKQKKKWENATGFDEHCQDFIDDVKSQITKYLNANAKQYEIYKTSALTDLWFWYEIVKEKNNIWISDFINKYKVNEKDEEKWIKTEDHWSSYGKIIRHGCYVSAEINLTDIKSLPRDESHRIVEHKLFYRGFDEKWWDGDTDEPHYYHYHYELRGDLTSEHHKETDKPVKVVLWTNGLEEDVIQNLKLNTNVTVEGKINRITNDGEAITFYLVYNVLKNPSKGGIL